VHRVDESRNAEIAALVLDQEAPCAPAGASHAWSCATCLTGEQYRQRKAENYGFKEGELDDSTAQQYSRYPGNTTDTYLSPQIPYIPSFTTGPGYLRMNFTKEMHGLVEYYAEKAAANQIGPHKSEDNAFLKDSHTYGMLNLHNHGHLKQLLIKEMQVVMEWWADKPLRHTATYGIRVYRRDAMLINHVDRPQTHVISAVVNIAQEVDKDAGWPLELLKFDGTVCEVYLQPGEMVLYEGARLRHGRPLRFKGDAFANVFSHYAPHDWYGVEEAQQQDQKTGTKREMPKLPDERYGRPSENAGSLLSGRGSEL